MDGGTATFLLTQGVLGVACLVLGGVVRFLYKENTRLHDKIDTLQQARLDDQKETADKVIPVLSNFSQTAAMIYSKIKIAKSGNGSGAEGE